MNAGLADLIERHDRVVRLEDAHASAPRHVIKYALARRHLVSVLPGVPVEVDRIPDVEVRERAELLRAGEEAGTSQLRLPPSRSSRRRDDPPDGDEPFPRSTVAASGSPDSERSIVDSWASLTRPGQRAPAILAVSERRTTHYRLHAEPQVVRDETGAVLETHQRQLAA